MIYYPDIRLPDTKIIWINIRINMALFLV